MNVIEGTGEIVAEPEWELLFSDALEVAAAKEHWRVITTEMKDRQLLAAANGHAIQRLVCAYLMHDRMYRHVAEAGVVMKPRRRSAATKAERKVKRERAADAYLGKTGSR